jgi:hypothetical protein
MKLFQKPFQIIRANLRTYVILNIAAYGLFLIGFVIGLMFPNLSTSRTETLTNDGTADLVFSIFSNPVLLALLILAVNTLQLSVLTIVLPSLIVPFGGLAAFAVWVVTTGVTLAPVDARAWVVMIPHSLTLVIEVQAYIIVLLGAFLIAKYWLRPQTIGAPTRRRGYVRGLQHLAWLAIPAFALLIIGAIWEAYSLSYLVGPMLKWLL